MKVNVIGTATNLNHEGFKQFKDSLDRFDWNYDILTDTYKAYGSKMVNAYNYAKQTDCTHLFILDTYDIIVLGTMQQAIDRIDDIDSIIFNAEKGCWPYSDWAEKYPKVKSDWKYLNGGACFVNVDLFIKMFEDYPIKHSDNDQVNLAEIYLKHRDKYNMKLDTNCDLFQSVAFESEDDFEYRHGILINKKTGTQPLIIHGNGKTNMDKVYGLLV